MKRIWTLGLVAVALSAPLDLAAQSAKPAPPAPAALAKGGFKEVTDWILKAAETVPESSWSYKPTPEVRTFGQVVAHVIDGANYYCGLAIKPTPWRQTAEDAMGSKAVLIGKLKDTVNSCNVAYATPGANLMPLMSNVAHANLHYGNIITYMRMLKLTPPSS